MSDQKLSNEEQLKRDWPEVNLLTTTTGRYEAYLTIHGDWANSVDEAWASLAEKLKGRK